MNAKAKITRILVPTDFSGSAEAACRLAARLAMRVEAQLVVFHALSGAEMVRQVGSAQQKTQVGVLNEVRDRLRVWFEAAVPAEFREFLAVEFHVKVTEPVPGIAWAANRSRSDLILMATRGRAGLANLLLGSVTEAVLRTVPVPVLALRAGQDNGSTGEIRRILWATDLSPISEEAWSYALVLADVLAAELALLHVVRPSELAALAEQPGPVPSGWMDRYLEPLEQELARRQRDVEALGLRARWKVAVGAPAEVIVTEAQAQEAGLIVVGTHGRTGLSHALLGSVAAAIIRKAPCPVLAVRVRPEAGQKERKSSGAATEATAAGGR